MKKIISLIAFVVLACLSGGLLVAADKPFLPSSEVLDATYHVKAGTTSVPNTTVSFPGYGTDVHFQNKNGTATISGTWTLDGSSITLYNGDTLNIEFARPASSPTVTVINLLPGASLQYQIGGLKQDKSQ